MRSDVPHGRKLMIAKEQLFSKAEQRKRRHDRNLTPIQYEVGQLVLIKKPRSIISFGPVSYTHLDVYKRQA